MNPSNFLNFPFGSIFQQSEHEEIALNIMVILNRIGNFFPDELLSWENYKKERLKDSNFSEGEKKYFTDVIPYCKNAETARLFSKRWNQNNN